jgi:hypothetical protein
VQKLLGLAPIPTAAGTNWTHVFLVPCALTVLCAVAFLLFFRDQQGKAAPTAAEPT